MTTVINLDRLQALLQFTDVSQELVISAMEGDVVSRRLVVSAVASSGHLRIGQNIPESEHFDVIADLAYQWFKRKGAKGVN